MLSCIEHFSSLLAGLSVLITKLHRVQNCAVRLVGRAPPNVHITRIFWHLQWLTVKARIVYKSASQCLTIITHTTTLHLLELLQLCSRFPPLRSCALCAPTPAPQIFLSKCAIVLYRIVVLLSGTHCLFTLQILQQLILSSLHRHKVSSTSKRL